MKNDRDSDYAANKYARGIAYRFANETVEITLEDYLRENLDKTERVHFTAVHESLQAAEKKIKKVLANG